MIDLHVCPKHVLLAQGANGADFISANAYYALAVEVRVTVIKHCF